MRYVSKVVAATNATLNVPLGFNPTRVKILNATDLTGLEYSSVDTVNTNGVTVAAAGDKAKAASAAAGVAAYAGSLTESKGITIGASATVNDTAADVLVIEAWFYEIDL